MDAASVISELFKVSPVLALAAGAVIVLWRSNQKKDQTLMDTMNAHAADRKETQQQIVQIVSQNSTSSLQLASSVDNLAQSNKDVVNRLASVEQAVQKNGRQRLTAAPKAA